MKFILMTVIAQLVLASTVCAQGSLPKHSPKVSIDLQNFDGKLYHPGAGLRQCGIKLELVAGSRILNTAIKTVEQYDYDMDQYGQLTTGCYGQSVLRTCDKLGNCFTDEELANCKKHQNGESGIPCRAGLLLLPDGNVVNVRPAGYIKFYPSEFTKYWWTNN